MACVVRDEGPVYRLLEAAGIRDALVLFSDLDEATAHVLSDLSDREQERALEP